MTEFKKAIYHAVAQVSFHYHDAPWTVKETIIALKSILEQDLSDLELYQQIDRFCTTLPRIQSHLNSKLRNMLTVFDHSVHEVVIESLTVLDANVIVQNWASFPNTQGIVIAIGFNAASHLHVIQIQNNIGHTTVYLHDPIHQFAARVDLQHRIQPTDVLLKERQILRSYKALANNPRHTLIQFMESNNKPDVLSVVDPDKFCPDGEIILKMSDGSLETINMQGNTLFLGESDIFHHDDQVHFTLINGVDATEKDIPIRIWHKPWQKMLSLEVENPKAAQYKIESDPEILPPARQKIIIALHGLFGHKGMYNDMAKTLLALSDPDESLLVIAADWPTYGASSDRDQPMPPLATMKQYFMALLNHIVTTYPDSEQYLVGESLGATMILACSREIEAFQALHSCIKGAIAMTPAIHDPSTNLYLQKRFIGFSTTPSVFRAIWNDDPEVNHQHAVARTRATIPYLSEAFRDVQHWSQEIPCAVFLASHDSVVTKPPALALYRSLKNDKIVFYAFPSRHLLLQSRPEGAKYIDRHTIYQDIASTVSSMSSGDFSSSTTLPYSGAVSAETMMWYEQVYRSYSISCCKRVTGYLTEWPGDSAMKLPVLKSNALSISSISKEKKDFAPLKESLFGIFPDRIQAANFIEHPVVGDDDCGFHVLGVTRSQLVDRLLPLEYDLNARQLLVPEIRATLLVGDVPEHIKPAVWRELKHQYQIAWKELDRIMIEAKTGIDEPYPDELGLSGRVDWLNERITAAATQTLTTVFSTFEEKNQEIDAFCQLPETFTTYVRLYEIPKTLWLGYQTALLWAQISHVSLMIWRKNTDDASMLTLINVHQATEESNVIHMLHTSGFTHFNLLEQTNIRNLAEERDSVLRWNQVSNDWSLDHTLYELLVHQAHRTPDNIAVIAHDKTLTYREVLNYANRIAHTLKESGAIPNQLIAILMHKGWEQIVASFGIIGSGAAFLPIDADWPETRIQQVMIQGQVRLVLTQQAVFEELSTSSVLSEVTSFVVDNDFQHFSSLATTLPRQQRSNDIAYVIFTSGSTGQPKGVIISHQNALNTILDINQRFSVNEHDKVLALSNLSFDLAIYDIFGILSVGGAIVLPEANRVKEPSHWINLLTTHQITMWNTVPMFMQMLVEYLNHLPDNAHPALENTLRVTLLSGDWVPLELPYDVQHHFTSTLFISLGGATEGSIWSIIYPVEAIDPDWKSIPYGMPMTNQHMYVLDEQLNYTPFDIIGEIHIGGKGVALGYWNDPKRTAVSFITHPETGERLYKTGDLGKWSSKGYIEFIGRKDTQVKISGHRIELGEIESSLSQHPSVKQCAVVTCDQGKQKKLAAYVVPNSVEAEKFIDCDEYTKDWTEVYEGIYQSSTVIDPTLNTAGWRSSYTGELISEHEMREWVENTVNRILALNPKNVLEIGCGTGLLVSRIAPHCTSYIATDISPTAVAMVRVLAESTTHLNHVTALQRPADDFSEWDVLEVDTIIINSVTQHFPSAEYLLEVVNKATKLLLPSGCLFIGDIRNLDLLEAYHASVQLHKTTTHLSKDEFLRKVQAQMQHEKELLISPDFFYALRNAIPGLQHVQVQIKSEELHNEMSKFRYDTTLYISNEPVFAIIPTWQDWTTESDLHTLYQQLQVWKESDPTTLQAMCIKAIPNIRLSQEAMTLQWLHTVDNFGFDSTAALKASIPTGIEPHVLIQLGKSLGLRTELYWNDEYSIQLFDVVFLNQPASVVGLIVVDTNPHCIEGDPRQYVNNPLISKLQHSLVPELIRHLEVKLPYYMVPFSLTLLAYMPLSSNGKVDRKALPEPLKEVSQQQSYTTLIATNVETILSQLFCEALDLDNVNIDSNFFDLGGNSLLAVHLITKINQRFETTHPVSLLFTHQTIQELSEVFQMHDTALSYRPMLVFHESGKYPPVFFVHSGRGGAEAYITLASSFHQEQPIYVIENYNYKNDPPLLETIEAMATKYLAYVQSVQQAGPFYLGGWSLGGVIAFEMAQIIKRQGQEVKVVYFLDTILFTKFECSRVRAGLKNVLQNDPFYRQLPQPYQDHVKEADRIQTLAMLAYKPLPYAGDVVLLKASDKWSFLEIPEFRLNWAEKKFMHKAFAKQHNGWSKLIPNLQTHSVSGHHQAIMEGDNAHTMARIIQADILQRCNPIRISACVSGDEDEQFAGDIIDADIQSMDKKSLEQNLQLLNFQRAHAGSVTASIMQYEQFEEQLDLARYYLIIDSERGYASSVMQIKSAFAPYSNVKILTTAMQYYNGMNTGACADNMLLSLSVLREYHAYMLQIKGPIYSHLVLAVEYSTVQEEDLMQRVQDINNALYRTEDTGSKSWEDYKRQFVDDEEQYYESYHMPRISSTVTIAYGTKELIENWNSIKYITREIIAPLLPVSVVKQFEELFRTLEVFQEVANYDIIWIGVHLTANIIGLKSLPSCNSVQIAYYSGLNTATYTAKYYAYQQSHQLVPKDLNPIETPLDFISQCGLSTVTGAVLGTINGISTVWVYGGIGAGKIMFDAATGAFFHGVSCYEQSWDGQEQQEKGYIESAVPYIADAGVGIYMISYVSHITSPADIDLKKIVMIQKATAVLSSVVMTDMTTKAIMSIVPEEIKVYANAKTEGFFDAIKEAYSNIFEYIVGESKDANTDL